MNKRFLLPLFLFLASSLAYSQQANTLTIRFAGAPSGPCAPFMLAVNNATGGEYNCTSGGAWNLIGGGGAGGTVTSVSFTGGLISVATPTTTPAFTVAGTSGGIPFFDSTSTWNTSALLASNSPLLGGGAGATPKTATFLTTDGAAKLTVGIAGGGNGALALAGNTSGASTFTAAATAGTATNNVVMTNGLSGPDGAAATPTYSFTNSPGTGLWQTGNFAVLGSSGTQIYFQTGATSKFFVNANNFDPFASGTQGLGEATQVFANVFSNKYTTGTNCSSGASPAVCAAAASGSVALPTGTNPTLVVNTTAVTANSQILMTVDESLGTKLGVTCNTTLSTLVNPVVTARTAGTSFTFTIGAVIASNPACVSYTIIN